MFNEFNLLLIIFKTLHLVPKRLPRVEHILHHVPLRILAGIVSQICPLEHSHFSLELSVLYSTDMHLPSFSVARFLKCSMLYNFRTYVTFIFDFLRFAFSFNIMSI
jgi:hypothetical protein